ncbi:MAG: cobalamin biosynthesis protein CbiG [Ruminococcaceae bacterium]|nr:cobalamin biosynthesis protein CbiG [Oscillospiraceae bacterium]
MKKGEIACLAFTERGRALAQTLCASLGGTVSCTRDGVSLADWTAEAFASCRALVYVGAAGIAVRAIAPHLVSKASDPAVLAVDECGRFAVPLASGHLGGANELARRIARVCGATAVITTATDVNGVFAADEWARVQDMAIADVSKIKAVSAKLLAGETVAVRAAFPIDGAPPEGVCLTASDAADAWVDVRAHDVLTLVPRALVLGVGCKRGTTAETLEERFAEFCAETGVLPEAVRDAATIDLKRGEAGLSEFCAAHGWPLAYYTAEELAAVEGEFSTSAFVARTTGVDNVCERAAVRRAGGELIVKKTARGGVTFALAKRNLHLDWRWRNG